VKTRDYKGNPHRYIFSHHLFGKTKSPETREKIRQTKLGSRNAAWKGERAGYAAVHNWMHRHFTKTGTCGLCKRERRTEWANLFGEYRHVREDFLEMCVPCHRRYDRMRKRHTHLRIGEKDG